MLHGTQSDAFVALTFDPYVPLLHSMTSPAIQYDPTGHAAAHCTPPSAVVTPSGHGELIHADREEDPVEDTGVRAGQLRQLEREVAPDTG